MVQDMTPARKAALQWFHDRGGGGWGSFFFGIGGLSCLDESLNVFYWAVLFGYPEVMVAYKALTAARMM